MLPAVSLSSRSTSATSWPGAITSRSSSTGPGLGTLTVEALAARDYPVLQGIFLVLSIAVVLANLCSPTWVYGRLDPRVRA